MKIPSVKVASMDAEHDECAVVLRRLASEQSVQALEATLQCLSDHFAHEEELMEEFGFGTHADERFSARKAHIKDHTRILDKLRAARAASSVPTALVREVLRDFNRHASEYDASYADTLSSKGAR